VVFFFDCDNTLLDNDRFRVDLDRQLERNVGADGQTRYWHHYDELREASGYADYLGALQRLRLEREGDPRLAELASFLLDYPFADRLYPGALEAIAHCSRWGTPAILSDGDAVFQPRKVERSGLWQAFDNRVLIYVHKEQELEYVRRLYPADHYVLIDDKLRILSAVKKIWRERVTTVFPKQGHYALDPNILADYPPADMELAKIGDLLAYDLSAFVKRS
jgi:FMN phosphatase YigB (HAD superfamily)